MTPAPIKRNKHIVSLSREHHFGLLFCWKIRQGIKKNILNERIVEYVQYFWQQHLSSHFIEEETILFTALKDSLIERALEEHKNIRTKISEIKTIDDKAQQRKLGEIADMVDEHIRFEERILFPFMEKNLTDSQLNQIGRKLKENDLAYKTDSYPDEFWK